MNYIKKYSLNCLWRLGFGPLVRLIREPEKLILAYHSIHLVEAEASFTHISISKFNFEAQLDYLKGRGYRFVYFRDLLNYSNQKVAAIYFDDGFKDVLENAYPVLKKNGIPATLFLTTEYADQKKNVGMYLTWGEIVSMADIFEFGSHSISHVKLNKISREKASEELRQSKKIIEERLGVKVFTFSFPYGRSNSGLESIAKKVGYSLTTADSRFHKARPDPDDSLDVFKWKVLRA